MTFAERPPRQPRQKAARAKGGVLPCDVARGDKSSVPVLGRWHSVLLKDGGIGGIVLTQDFGDDPEESPLLVFAEPLVQILDDIVKNWGGTWTKVEYGEDLCLGKPATKAILAETLKELLI